MTIVYLFILVQIAENNCEEFLGLMGEENIAQVSSDFFFLA